MLTREFASTGVEVPLIGQGTWKMDSDGVEALSLGIDLGMTHIDTAEMYTGAEEIVAKAIHGQREKIFLVSKVLPEHSSRNGVIRACNESLKRLKTDYLDVYLLHWWNGTRRIVETMHALEELVVAGMTRFIGVSNLDRNQLEIAERALTREPLVCNQVMYHLESRDLERQLLRYCRQRGAAIIAHTPFGRDNFPPLDSPAGKVLAAIAEKHGKTARQVVLNFITREGIFAIPKASNLDHVRENAGAVGWDLDAEDLKLINTVFPPPVEDPSTETDQLVA